MPMLLIYLKMHNAMCALQFVPGFVCNARSYPQHMPLDRQLLTAPARMAQR
jgi:hypothetical protein